MPEQIRALIVIFFIASIVFAFTKKSACQIIPKEDFNKRRNLWFGLTLLAFVTQNFWVYIIISGLVLTHASKRESNLVALFFFLLFVVPVSRVQIPGFGLVNFLFALSHQRLLVLVILLPAYLALTSRKDTLSFGKMFSDKLLIGYIVLSVALYLRETTLTDTLRQAFYQFIDIYLPYYVVSRSLKKIEHFRDAILCFVIAAMILAAIGVFEATRHWLLYKSLINSGMTSYLLREGFIRATASAGHPIVLGYVLAIAFGLYLYLRPLITSKIIRQLGLILLCLGLLAPLSRGPWVGAACIVLVFIATGKNPVRGFSILFLFGVIAIPVSLILPGGEVFIELLPFVGTADKSTVDFRGQLFEASMIVINRYPWFGSIDYLEAPEMEALRQNGLIDIVNSYVGIALERGFIGVGLFIGFCLSIMWGIYRRFRRLPDTRAEEHLLGRVILASFVGLMVIIGTVSSIGVVSIVQWSIAGIGAAYINMMVEQQRIQVKNENESVLSRQFSR